jgi:hypothetical protein
MSQNVSLWRVVAFVELLLGSTCQPKKPWLTTGTRRRRRNCLHVIRPEYCLVHWTIRLEQGDRQGKHQLVNRGENGPFRPRKDFARRLRRDQIICACDGLLLAPSHPVEHCCSPPSPVRSRIHSPLPNNLGAGRHPQAVGGFTGAERTACLASQFVASYVGSSGIKNADAMPGNFASVTHVGVRNRVGSAAMI